LEFGLHCDAVEENVLDRMGHSFEMNLSNAPRCRIRFTIVDLLMVVAVSAVVAGMVAKVKQDRSNKWLEIYSMAISSDGNRIAAAFADRRVKAWNLADGTPIASLPPLDDLTFEGAAISPDGRTIARAYRTHPDSTRIDETLEIRDLDTGRELLRRNFVDLEEFLFSTDGKRLAIKTSDGISGGWLFIDPHDSTASDVFVRPPAGWDFGLTAHYFYLRDLTAPTNLDLLYTVDHNHLSQWDVVTGRARQREFQSVDVVREAAKIAEEPEDPDEPFYPDGPVSTVAPLISYLLSVSPDGKRIAVGRHDEIVDGKADTIIEFIDPATLATIREAPLPTTEERLWSMDYCNGGKSLAFTGNSVTIVNAETFENEKEFSIPLSSPTVGPDGKLLAMHDEESIYLYDGATLRKFVDFRPTTVGMFWLVIGLVIVLAGWGMIRWRRSVRHRASNT
jgi:WD40 repeat protein